ncbi:hypothetical protein BHM03_00035019, partial [Ensete ventricosum]
KLLYHVELHVILEHKPGINRRRVVLLGFLLHQGGRREDDGVTARVVERGDGHPVAVPLRHHPVQHALVLAIRDHLRGTTRVTAVSAWGGADRVELANLKLIPEVDDDGVAHRGHVDPLAVLEELEAADAVVLEEQDDATGVSVSSESLDELRARAWRVAADLGPKAGTFGPAEGLLEVTLLQPQILAEQIQKTLRQHLQLRCEFLHHLPESGRPQGQRA